jgi:membrane-anchored mycosin MYCP
VIGVRLRCAVSALATGALVTAAGLVWAVPASADQVQNGQWYLTKLGVRQAWSITKGRGVKVAVIDSGVDGSVADLRGAVVAGRAFSSGDDGQAPVDGNNHGTNVGSLVAGRGHGAGHASGVLGTAPAARIITASFAIGHSTDDSPQAIRWAVDNGAKVLNLSYNSTFPGQEDAVRYAEAKDVVVVAATGDTFAAGQRNRVGMPASFPGVLAVTGVDQNLKSDPGAVIGAGTAIAAPFSTTPSNPDSGAATTGLPVANPSGAPAGAYIERTGTSLSAPIVAGIVALVRAKFPDLDAANVINRVLKTATPAGGSVPNGTYGYGVVNALAALTANVPEVVENPLGSLVTSAPSGSVSSPAPRSSTPPASSSPNSGSPAPGSTAPAPSTSSAPAASSADSSGLGAGAWIAIIAIVLIAAAVIVWLLTRNRTPPPGAAPPGYAPSGPPPPPGYPPP